MTVSRSLYFKGASIAAGHALRGAIPGLLEVDAQKLAVLPVRELALAGGEESSPVEQYGSMACAWLQNRSRNPRGTLDWDAFASSPEIYEIRIPSLDAAGAAARATLLFDDESFASLLSGTQAALSFLHPDATGELLLQDLDDIQAALDELRDFYAKKGVPKADISEFIVHAYLFLRLHNGGRALSSLWSQLWTGQGYGRLDVDTAPTPADVYVDGKAMAKSPARLYVTPGSHPVEGRSAGLKAQQTVAILANQIVPLSLKLA